MTNSQPATAYPTKRQYARWKSRAEEYGMTVSEFIQAMVEAGLKNFDAQVEPDESRRELRQQRNDIKEELEHARNRIEYLESKLHDTERETVESYIRQNPGCSYEDVVQRVIDTAPSRVNDHLHSLEGESVENDDGRYYPVLDEKSVVENAA